jgi:general nucleoside transport system permease protein
VRQRSRGVSSVSSPALVIGTVLRSAWRAGGILVVALVLVATMAGLISLLTLASGYDPIRALEAAWTGSLGTRYAVLSATLVRATPLILTGLAVTLAFTAGVMNIGAEGQLLAGATAAVAVGLAGGQSWGWVTLPLAVLSGGIAGALWAYVPAWLRRQFGVLEVISTIMMNFIAVYLVGYLVRGPLQEPLRIYPQSPSLPESARLPLLITGARLHWGFVVALVSAVLLWWALRSTAAGFRVRVLGGNPHAAHAAALIDVGKTSMRAFLLSGFLAGLAGAIEVTGVTYSLYENLSPGYGYTAIAVALVGSLNPLLTALSGVLFGALEAGASAMQRDAGIPSVLASVVEAVMILLLIGVTRIRTPASVFSSLRFARREASLRGHGMETP